MTKSFILGERWCVVGGTVCQSGGRPSARPLLVVEEQEQAAVCLEAVEVVNELVRVEYVISIQIYLFIFFAYYGLSWPFCYRYLPCSITDKCGSRHRVRENASVWCFGHCQVVKYYYTIASYPGSIRLDMISASIARRRPSTTPQGKKNIEGIYCRNMSLQFYFFYPYTKGRRESGKTKIRYQKSIVRRMSTRDREARGVEFNQSSESRFFILSLITFTLCSTASNVPCSC